MRLGNDNTRGRFSAGKGRPLSRASSGLGSNVSRCDGPPNMNSTITRFAFGGACGGRTASGLLAAAKSSASMADKASVPNPAPSCDSHCRRDTRSSLQGTELWHHERIMGLVSYISNHGKHGKHGKMQYNTKRTRYHNHKLSKYI